MNFTSAINLMNVAAIGGARVGANGAAPESFQALPFQHLIAIDGALPELDLELDPALALASDAATPAATPQDPAEAADEALAAEVAAPGALLAAMTPPVAPAALPAMMMAMPGARPGATDASDPVDVAAATDAAPVANAPARSANDIPTLALPAAARADAVVAQAQPPATASAHTTPGAPAAPAVVQAEGDGPEAAPTATATATATTTAAAGGASQPATVRGADSLTLAGPPSAWRQNLHEALGDRLQLQLGRGIEQATIRLEPPMLGRIDISVRHSGGNLEVHIAASNSDVLRQLNTVSDSLRNDLAGRQYSNVAVSVSETPRAQASAQAGQQHTGQPGADAQGRGRQQGDDAQRQRTPGLALNDAGDAGSLFSMNERERP